MAVVNIAVSELIEKLNAKSPGMDPFDWFVVGFLYHCQHNAESVEEVYTRVKKITDLKTVAHLSNEEKNDFLIRMVDKIAVSGGSQGKTQSQPPTQPDVRHGDSSKTKASSQDEVLSDVSYNSDLDKPKSPRRTVTVKKTVQEYIGPDGKVAVREYSNFKRIDSMEEEKLSMELIKKLQEEEESMRERAEERRRMQEEEETCCDICMCNLYEGEWIPLLGCIHMFHTECVKEHMKIQSRSFPLKCPGEGCGLEIAQQDIQDVLDEEDLKKYYDYSFQQYVDTHADEVSCCPTADCTFAFVREEDQIEFKCNVCKKHYCLDCRAEWHKGMTCKEYKVSSNRDVNDEKFEKLLARKKFKQCAKCKFWVEKNQGCDHMTCRCGYEFCYKCGGKYRQCECFKKMREEMERRRAEAQARRRNKRRKR